MNKYFLYLFLVTGFLFSCTEGELITPGDEYLIEDDPGAYQVEIEGVLNDYSYQTGAESSTEMSHIDGETSSVQTISISIPQIFEIGEFTEQTGAKIEIMTPDGMLSNVNDSLVLPFQLSITQVDNMEGAVTGVFQGEVFNLTTGDTLTLTNGLFDRIQFEPPVVNNRILKANFNDVEFDFSQDANATGIAANTIISGFSTDQIKTLSIQVPGGIQEGMTYTDADQVVFQVKLDTSTSPLDIYSNYDTTTDTYLPVSIKITNITEGTAENPGRVIGIFSGSISKFDGNPEVVVSDGQINVPITE